jgi:hypothetical protein
VSGLPLALREAIFALGGTGRGREIAERAAVQSASYRAGGGLLATVTDQPDIAACLTARLRATFAAISAALAAARARAPDFQPVSTSARVRALQVGQRPKPGQTSKRSR